MRAVAAIIFVAVIIVALFIAWYVIFHRGKIADRRRAHLADLQDRLLKVRNLVDNYSPTDPMGAELERQAREIFVSYFTMLSVGSTEKRWLQGAEVAYARLSALIDRHPQSLFAPSDDVSKTFIREAFSALHPAQPKEIPHVP